MKFISAKDQKPSVSDADWLGYVLCRVRHGRDWMFDSLRIDDPALLKWDWQWLQGANESETDESTPKTR